MSPKFKLALSMLGWQTSTTILFVIFITFLIGYSAFSIQNYNLWFIGAHTRIYTLSCRFVWDFLCGNYKE